MSTRNFKHFKSDQAELILLRLKLADIDFDFWLDLDGFYNYTFKGETEIVTEVKSNQLNWTRIDEVVSEMAYDASILFPESVFTLWYNQHEEYHDYETVIRKYSGSFVS